MPNIWRLGQVTDTKFGTNVSNKILLNAAIFQGYSYYRFSVIKGKPTGGRGIKLPPPSVSLKKNGKMIAVSRIVPRLDELNNKAAKVNNRLELKCKQRSLPYISHCETTDPNKHLNESNLYLNSYGIRVFAENFSNFLSKSN